MKVLRNPRLVLPLVLITLLIGATTAYVAISANFINCASLEGGACTGEDGQTGDSDVINGSSGADIIYGDGGDDLIFGNDGDDELYGEYNPEDTGYELQGEPGNDTIFGGSGDDILCGGEGSDTIWGGPGFDQYCDLDEEPAGPGGHNTFIFQPGDVPEGETETPPETPSEDTTVCVFLGYSGTEMFVVAEVVEQWEDLDGDGEKDPWEQWEEIDWECYGEGLVVDPRTDPDDNPGLIDVSDCDVIYGLVTETTTIDPETGETVEVVCWPPL